nr:hypothetical protein [Tanacetum cinerariifolium]
MNEIDVIFVNILLEKWLCFSQGLRNANHIQTLDLTDIYERFVYEDNLILRKYIESKKALIPAPITMLFMISNNVVHDLFSNNVVHDFQENSDDKVSDDEEIIQFKVLMALDDDKLAFGKNQARNGEWTEITMRK